MKKLFLLTLLLSNLSFASDYNSDEQKLQLADCFSGKAPDKYSWIGSMLFSNSMAQCFQTLSQQKKISQWSLKPLELISGVAIDKRPNSKIIKEDNYRGEDELHLNPQFIQWLENYFILAKNDSKLFKKTEKLYLEYQNFIRNFALAYQFITKQKEFDQELSGYQKNLSRGNNAVEYIFEQYQNELETTYPKVVNSDGLIYSVGFWLRRGMDGSKEQLYKILTKLLQTYDLNWYEKIDTYAVKATLAQSVTNLLEDQIEQLQNCMKGHAPNQYGWMNATFLYGEGMSCFDSLLNRKRPDFYSLSALELLSGLKLDSRKFSSIIAKDRYRGGHQLYLNPAFILWLEQNFIHKDKSTPLYINTLALYKEYKDFVRSFALAYDYIMHENSFTKEFDFYKEIVKSRSDVVDYLFKKYQAGVTSRYRDVANKDAIVYGIGFWMRRTIDASKVPLKKLLDTLLKTYDEEWYLENFGSKTPKVIKSSPELKW